MRGFKADKCGTNVLFVLFTIALTFVWSANGDCRLNAVTGLLDGPTGCCGNRTSDGIKNEGMDDKFGKDV